ncbi:prefoldin subunit 4 like protein [Zymoseptoria brevis]|uniref:Prefoldin subunit 4 n=1 Tax=Zymoseptoria brevis TaxID=1047168 RepID=A0A0F4GUP5_9PEZI|nr:prefoldin subunit 4 like protein [Zymoseptoria brevis]
MLSRRMLSREEEATIGEEKEVRREDQEKINRFSRLHSREKILEDELKVKQKDKEDLEEISGELELADEDDKLPYKIGDSFFSLPVPEVQELLSASVERIDGEVEKAEEKLKELREEMQELKEALYGRFGKSINLEA